MQDTYNNILLKKSIKRVFFVRSYIRGFIFLQNKTPIMQIIFPILLVKRIFNTSKEFFFYELNNSNEVKNYTLTNDPLRHLKKFNNNFCLVRDLKVKFDEKMYIDFSEIENDIFEI